ncbi:MAG: hypothetical protein GY803_31160 [Chloroflexi bacterium]|nr:hypothetical protein [Chloroflexota bacterium]
MGTAVSHPTLKLTTNGRPSTTNQPAMRDGRPSSHTQVANKRPFLPTTNQPARVTAVSHPHSSQR